MDIITNLINKAGSISTYINAISEWLKKQSSVYNDKLYSIINDESNDPFVVGDNVLSAQQLRDVVNGDMDESTIDTDLVGKPFMSNDVLTNIGNQNSVFIIKACALEALAAGNDAAECNSIFFNNLSVQLGDITLDNNSYCGYISSILLSGGSSSSKIKQIIQGDMPEQSGFTQTASESYTGINPFTGFCNTIDLSWENPIEDINTAISTTWNVLNTIYDRVVNTQAIWLVKKTRSITKTMSNPIDVVNVDGGQDLSFMEGYYRLSVNIPCPADWISNHLNQYCCVVVLGATVYFHIAQNGIDYVYIKKHLYDPAMASAIYDALASSTSINLNKVYAVINSGHEFMANIREDSDELYLYKGLVTTERLIYAGLQLAAGNSIESFVQSYNPDYFDPIINAMTSTAYVNDVSAVTNALWVSELNEGTVNDYLSEYNQLLSAVISNLDGNSAFYPYSWVNGPLQGSYSIKTDIQNIEAVSNTIKTFITTAVVIIAGVVAIKSFSKVKNLALNAMRQYDLAYYDINTDSATLKKLRRKANALKAISGSSFRVPTYKSNSSSDNDEIVFILKG